MDGNQIVSNAKSKLLIREPFFGYLVLKLKFISDAVNTKTMATDGRCLWFNHKWCVDKTLEEIIGVLIHELMHCVFRHPVRGKDHIPLISNYAADYVVNDYIINKTNFTLPGKFLYEPRFTDMSYEAVYAILLDEYKKDPSKFSEEDLGDYGVFIIPEESPEDSPDDISLDKFWEIALQESNSILKATGKQPSVGSEMLLDLTKPPQLPWNKILRRFMHDKLKARSDWTKPNPRYAHTGLILPSKHEKTINHIVGAVDTSCSVTRDELDHINAEVNKILLQLKPRKFTLIHCDTQIRKIDTYTANQYPVRINIKGRGGTAFAPVFEHVKQAKLNPTCLIYFSDLEGYFDFPKPRYPTLWINTSWLPQKRVASFGQTIGLIR